MDPALAIFIIIHMINSNENRNTKIRIGHMAAA